MKQVRGAISGTRNSARSTSRLMVVATGPVARKGVGGGVPPTLAEVNREHTVYLIEVEREDELAGWLARHHR